MSVFAFNFGAGLKALIGNSAALRLEYRYISYSEEGNHFRTDQNILAGVSIFF
jgi:opacity protein-like surface antigen